MNQDLCQLRWQRHQQLLMRQAPEMGIALLNSAVARPPIVFHGGYWERTSAESDQLISLSPGHQIAAENSASINQLTRALVIWGLGLGYWYLQLRPWLAADRTRQLIFCESEVMSAAAFLHMPWAEQLLTDTQVHVRAHFSGERQMGAMREIAWMSVLLPLQFLYSEYADLKCQLLRNKTKAAEQIVRGAHGQFDQVAAELLKFSQPFYANFYLNLLRGSHSFNARFLKGALCDLPALICGAGPSLKEQVDDLQMASKKYLLLAGGSGVNSLIAQGISPHFGLAIDPNPLQEQRQRGHTGFDVAYLFRRRLFASALDAICGPRILVDGGAGYPLVDWLDDQRLGDCDSSISIDEGHNVMHFAMDIARFMGIKNMVFCGMDLAYDQSGGYAPGVMNGHIGADLLPSHLCCADPLIFHQSDLGEIVQTHWKWVEESRWIKDYTARFSSTKLYNATPKGLGIEGVERVLLSELNSKDLPERDLKNRVWLELQRADWDSKNREIAPQQLLQPIWQSLARVENLCKESDQIANETDLAECSTGEKIELLLAQLEQELAYSLLLRFADQMHKVILERSLRPMVGVDQPPESWPNDVRAVIFLRRLKFLKKGCALHRKWWVQAQDTALEVSKIKVRGPTAKIQRSGAKTPVKGALWEKLRSRLAQLGKRSKMGNELIICEPTLDIDIQVEANCHLVPRDQTGVCEMKKISSGHGSIRCCERKNSAGEVEEIWLQSGRQRQGQSLLFYPDGKIKGEAFYKNHRLHGPTRYFLPSGLMTSELFFANGERQGYQRQFYADGSLYSAGGFRDGKRLGTHWSFHPNGQLKSKIDYCDDQISGVVQIFHSNGRAARKTRFVNGSRHGWDRQWFQEGRRAFEAQYDQGRPIKVARRWHGNGQLAERLIYLEPGGRVETAQFSDQGHKICRGRYRDSTHYLLKVWDERSHLVSEQIMIWREGALHSE